MAPTIIVSVAFLTWWWIRLYPVFYSRKEAFFESLCNDKSCLLVPGLLRLKPAPNDGTPGSLSHLLDPCEKAVDYESKSDGNLFKNDTCRYPSQPRECSKCVCPYCQVSRVFFVFFIQLFWTKTFPMVMAPTWLMRVVPYSDKFIHGIVLYCLYITILYRSRTMKNEAKQWEI